MPIIIWELIIDHSTVAQGACTHCIVIKSVVKFLFCVEVVAAIDLVAFGAIGINALVDKSLPEEIMEFP